MANVFDQFDDNKKEPSDASNVFDQFDQVGEPKKKSFFGDLAELAKNDPALGGVENLLSMITGGVSEAASGLSGIFGGGDVDARVKRIQDIQRAGTYQPRSPAGRDIQAGLSEALQPVGEALTATERFLGEGTLDITGSPELAAAAATLPTATLELLGLKGTRSLKKATPENITPETQPTLPETGIRATTGEASKDLAQQKAENFLAEQASEGGEQLRGYKLAQSREIKQYLEDVSPDQIDSVGDSVKQALELRENSAKFKRRQAYDKLGEVTKDLDVRLNTDIISESLPTPRELRNFERTLPTQYAAIDGLLNEFGFDLTDAGIQKAAKGGYDIEPLSVANIEDFRKSLNDIERADTTGTTSNIIGPLKSALDEEFDIASKALQETGSPDVSRAAKEARQSHIALKTEFDDKGLTKQLIDNKSYQSRIPKIEESQVYNKLIAKATPIEDFNRVVSSLNRAGTKGKRAKAQIQSQMVMDLIDSGFSAKSRKINGEQVFGANAFATRFDIIEPKLKSIMEPEQFNKLKKLRNDANDLIPPSGAMPKGSAGFFIEALDKAGLMGMMSSIPYAGPATAEFLRKIGKTSQDSKAFEKAVASNPEFKDALNLLATDYPSLAFALGIPLIREDEENK